MPPARNRSAKRRVESVDCKPSLALIRGFGLQLADQPRRHEAGLRQLRERSQRDEGLHALALQAASAAHALNTPLATIKLLVTELREAAPAGTDLSEDFDLLTRQLDHTTLALRQLVDAARPQPLLARPISAILVELESRLALLRPTSLLSLVCADRLRNREVKLSPTLICTLGTLLENAADAGLRAARPDVSLQRREEAAELVLEIVDSGVGLGSRADWARSERPDGWGLGRVLANATIEALGGSMTAWLGPVRGTRVELQLPWSRLDATALP